MSDANGEHCDRTGLRERLLSRTEEQLGQTLSELLDSPLLTGAIGRALDVRERAAQAQELAMGALNLPSAADIERLTRRLRSVSQRLEAIEDVLDRVDRTLQASAIERRLTAIEEHLRSTTSASAPEPPAPETSTRKRSTARARGTGKAGTSGSAGAGSKAAGGASTGAGSKTSGRAAGRRTQPGA